MATGAFSIENGGIVFENLDLSVPFGGSGMFIALHQNGVLESGAPLLTKVAHLKDELETVEAELRACNDFASLLCLRETFQRRGRDFEQEFQRKIDKLEHSKANLELELNNVRSQLTTIDHTLPIVADGIVGNRTSALQERLGAKKYSINVLHRLHVIGQHPDLNANELCKRLEAEDVPLPEPWQDKFGQCAWHSAYMNLKYRKRIDTMFSRDKKILNLR
jgi:hypothetical protein